MMKKTVDAFVECQKSVVNEINSARNELVCGRTEEAYNILTNLSDELTTDIRISEGKFEAVLDKACKNYAKKELNIESANENV